MQHWQSGLKAPSLILDEARSTSRGSDYLASKNSYSLDYSDEEPMSEHLSDHEDEDEVEVIYESAIQRDINKVPRSGRPLDNESASSSEIAERQEDSAPTSPAEEHIVHKIEVLSSQPQEDDVVVIKDQQSASKVIVQPQCSQYQSSELQSQPGSVRAQGETVDLISEMTNSEDDDEGYDELDNFSEMDSEFDWDSKIKSTDATKLDVSEEKDISENRAVSPSDAAMPKHVACSTLRNHNDQDRVLPEIFAPFSIPPSMPLSCYGNNQHVDFNSTNDGLFNKLPSIRPVTWYDQSLTSSAYPDYRFAPTSFSYQNHPLPSNPAKVSINSIIDGDTSGPTISNKRKRQADDTEQVDEGHETVASLTGDVPEPLGTFTAAIPCTSKDESINIQAASKNVASLESTHETSADNVKQKDPDACEASSLADAVLNSHECKTTNSSEDTGAVRPRKRVRTQGPEGPSTSRGKTMIKYAATALVGAAFGSIGTVFGLAALPADYFL